MLCYCSCFQWMLINGYVHLAERVSFCASISSNLYALARRGSGREIGRGALVKWSLLRRSLAVARSTSRGVLRVKVNRT